MNLTWLARIGEPVVERGRRYSYVASVLWGVARRATRRASWPPTIRAVLARQILFTGIEAVRFIALVAVLVGISVVVQTQVWLGKVGQSPLIGPVLVMVVVREIAPLLVNFIVIGRSGTAMATELATMKLNGEIRVLDAQGLDPFVYLVLPRVVGAAASVFCLTIVFIAVSFVSGYFSGALLGANMGPPSLFVSEIFKAVRPADVLNVIVKTLLPGATTGAICCAEGLGVGAATTEIPQAATRAVVRSVAAMFVLSALVSLLTYVHARGLP